MVQWFCLISWRLFDVWTSYFRIMSQYDTTFDLKINVGHCDLYFMVQWFCLVSWRLLDIWTPYFWTMSRYGPMFDLKINIGHCDLYFVVQWFCLISWWLFDVWTSYFRIMSQYDSTFDFKKWCRSLTYISWSSDFALYLEDIWYMNTILWDYESVWPNVWPKLNVGHCDQYFMVQWFCLISWRLFDVWTSYFKIVSQYDLILLSSK